MTSALDQKGLASVQREFSHVPPGLVEHIISAYLSTVTPAEIAGVVGKLRVHTCGCGGPCGQKTPPYLREAATLIERLAASQAETRRLALEEAAKERDLIDNECGMETGLAASCAAAIRALEKQEQRR